MEKVIMWKPEFETMPRGRLVEHQLNLFRKQMVYLYKHCPMCGKKFGHFQVRPEHIKTLEDVSKVPFTVKEDNFNKGLDIPRASLAL